MGNLSKPSTKHLNMKGNQDLNGIPGRLQERIWLEMEAHFTFPWEWDTSVEISHRIRENYNPEQPENY